MSIDMSKLASGAAYGASAGTIANGLLTRLTRLSPDEWSAVGVLAGILVALFTLGINWYYKRKATLAQIKALQRWPTAPDINED
ncbi:phage holin [Pantoea vagans]|uniref:phage holin n=1 Tax=Pantoea vagans TaxID=470934 RepID=UPI0028AD097C|nr:phage holin [Pantoea vagans]